MFFDRYEIHIQAFGDLLQGSSSFCGPRLRLFIFSNFQHFKVSKFPIFKISKLQNFKNGTYGFRYFPFFQILRFLDMKK